MKKLLSIFLITASVVLFTTALGCSSPSGMLIVMDGNGQIIAVLSDIKKDTENSVYNAYLEVVISETVNELCSLRGITADSAEKQLISENFTVYTSFDRDIYSSLRDACSDCSSNGLSFGGAVTDLHGHLLTVYSSGNSGKNNASAKTPPYSSFKPLSVYSPAFEYGVVTWSSMYEDSPYKKIVDDNGNESDWPSNASGIYGMENTGILTAVKKSLNTVAVKCLKDVGVNNSIDFLKDRFDLDLTYEANKAETYGEDEVIGNIAMGFLTDGVSVIDMAGYYQIFANGGYYSEPKAVLKLCDSGGNTVFERDTVQKKALEQSTAYIMNKLLQNVVSPGGTGEAAAIDGIPVGGKTGTGPAGNWFIGFTPNYSCAIWHGTEIEQNISSEVFSKAVSGFQSDSGSSFPECQNVSQAAYCCDSGLLFSPKCRRADIGYYASDRLPPVCDMH